MVTIIPQVQPRAPQSRIGQSLANLGSAVGEIGVGLKNSRREATQKEAFSSLAELAKGQGSSEDIAIQMIGSGDPSLAAMGLQALQQARSQAESRGAAQAGRQQAQSNADRAFGLQERRFDADTAGKAKDRQLKREEFDFSRKLKETELGLKRLDSAFAEQNGQYKSAKEKSDVEQGLRKEFTAISKDYRAARDAFARVGASASDPSAAGDMALIFNYMKVLDPGSVVRESEFALAAAAGSFGERIKAGVNRIRNGGRLSKEMRSDFVSRAKKLFDSQGNQYSKLVNQYEGIGNRLQLDTRNVVPDFGLAESGGNEPTTVNTPEEASKLPSGTQFLDPDGVLRVVP